MWATFRNGGWGFNLVTVLSSTRNCGISKYPNNQSSKYYRGKLYFLIIQYPISSMKIINTNQAGSLACSHPDGQLSIHQTNCQQNCTASILMLIFNPSSLCLQLSSQIDKFWFFPPRSSDGQFSIQQSVQNNVLPECWCWCLGLSSQIIKLPTCLPPYSRLFALPLPLH